MNTKALQEYFSVIFSKWAGLLQSRKFWVLVSAIVAVVAGYNMGEVTYWQAVQAIVAALSAYSIAVGIEDSGRIVTTEEVVEDTPTPTSD